MFTIRLNKRACTDQSKIATFLEQAQTGFLGLTDGNQPYVVPFNFIWKDGNFYFHSASAGRKLSIIEQNNAACFTVSEQYGTLTHSVPAHTDTAYMSVIAFGRIELVSHLDESTSVMQQLLNKYVPGFYDKPLSSTHVDKHRSSMGSSTLVWRFVCDSMTAKENEQVQERMFKPGDRMQSHK